MCDMAQPGTTSRRVQQQWRCDVCKEKTFLSFEAACAHEEECLLLQAAASGATESLPTTTTSVPSITAPKPDARREEPVEVIDILSSPEVVEVVPSKRKENRKPTKQASLFSNKASQKIDDVVIHSRSKKSMSSTNKTGKTLQRAPTKTSAKRTASSDNAGSIPLMFRGVDQGQLMAEQAAVELRAKRLLKQKQDRERAEKRQKQQEQQQDEHQQLIAVAPVDSKKQAASASRPKAVQGSRAPRFPVPSHVFPLEPTDELHSKPKMTATSFAAKMWWCREKSEPAVINVDYASDGNEPISFLPPKDSMYARQPPQVDCLQLAMDAILIPPKTTRTKSRTWADVYFNERLLVDGFVPAHLKDVSEEMIAFVKSWMVERHNAHNRAAEKQRQLSQPFEPRQRRRVKKTKKTQRYKDDDDGNFMSDSDGEAEEIGLKNLCHVIGPSGLGKSALVYAVAKHCGCRVIELNPSDKRGAAAIRKTIEEATQSHSSMALLKQQGASRLGTGLDGSDQEDAVGEAKSSSLTVILIDEIDNLDAGDSGFWSALSDLTKRAKCPIFLTSNIQPEEIKVVAGRCGVLPVGRPRPEDCTDFIRSILDGEGFLLRSDDLDVTQHSLSLVANLCNSDMRRIAHELQLFAVRPSSSEHLETPSPTRSLALDMMPFRGPRIVRVEPQMLRFDAYELLTVKGSGFMRLAASSALLDGGGYGVNVYIGEDHCPLARIMDDSTIFAVVAPIALPQLYKHFKRYHDEEYPRIAVSSVIGLGIVSTSTDTFSLVSFPNGDEILQLDPPVLIERHFSNVQHMNDESASEDEMELDEPKPGTSSTSIMARQKPVINVEEAQSLMEKAVKGWAYDLPVAEERREGGCDMEAVTEMSVVAGFASDAALIEDLATRGRPFLSGACRGFGFDLTDAYPATTNENTKPPSAEKLFSSTWNDNCYFFGDSECYMTFPPTARERNLVKLTESSLRGQSWSSLTTNASATIEETTEEAKEIGAMTAKRSAEDEFLSNEPPACLLSLPSYLRCNSCPVTGQLQMLSRDSLFDRQRVAKIEEEVDFLNEYVFPNSHPVTNYRFHRGISREIDPMVVSKELADPSLYEETLPLLRVICVLEKINKYIADSFKEGEADTRKSTRRTRNPAGATHCLERISPMFRAAEECYLTSWQVGERLIKHSLMNTKPGSP